MVVVVMVMVRYGCVGGRKVWWLCEWWWVTWGVKDVLLLRLGSVVEARRIVMVVGMMK